MKLYYLVSPPGRHTIGVDCAKGEGISAVIVWDREKHRVLDKDETIILLTERVHQLEEQLAVTLERKGKLDILLNEALLKSWSH